MENLQIFSFKSINLVSNLIANTIMELLLISAEAYKTVLARLEAIEKTQEKILELYMHLIKP